jgi:Putative MetA-pathway of phenol degradation
MRRQVSGWARWGGVILGAALLAPGGSPAYGQRQTADSNSGYIDSALIGNVARFRYDASYDDNVPDRAEFFYGKCGCFRVLGADPRAPGPPQLEKRIDYQDLSVYLEGAATDRLSGFVEVPYRFLNPEVNANTSGIADMNAGFKFAFLSSEDQVVTFQFKTYLPTGDSERGLGNNHVTLEPGLLFWKRLSDGLVLEGELRPWIPIGGTDFEGDIIRYGLGLSYEVCHVGCVRVVPVAEFVGWTILNGKELPIPPEVPLNSFGFAPSVIPAQDAGGETILNAKLGLRLKFHESSDLYLGYGRALTGTFWYKDTLRVEYRLAF